MTAPSIPALLEPIQERLDAATPGPWVVGKDRMERAILAGPYEAFLIAKVGDIRNPLLEDNAKLIAHAPTDTARLLAAVKAVDEFIQDAAEQSPRELIPVPAVAGLLRNVVEAALRSEA